MPTVWHFCSSNEKHEQVSTACQRPPPISPQIQGELLTPSSCAWLGQSNADQQGRCWSWSHLFPTGRPARSPHRQVHTRRIVDDIHSQTVLFGKVTAPPHCHERSLLVHQSLPPYQNATLGRVGGERHNWDEQGWSLRGCCFAPFTK